MEHKGPIVKDLQNGFLLKPIFHQPDLLSIPMYLFDYAHIVSNRHHNSQIKLKLEGKFYNWGIALGNSVPRETEVVFLETNKKIFVPNIIFQLEYYDVFFFMQREVLQTPVKEKISLSKEEGQNYLIYTRDQGRELARKLENIMFRIGMSEMEVDRFKPLLIKKLGISADYGTSQLTIEQKFRQMKKYEEAHESQTKRKRRKR